MRISGETSSATLPDLQRTADAIESSLLNYLDRQWSTPWTPGRLQVGREGMLKLRYRAAAGGMGARCEVEFKRFDNPHPPQPADALLQRLADGPNLRSGTPEGEAAWLRELFAELMRRIGRLHADRSAINHFDFSLYVWLDIQLGGQLQFSGRRMLIDEAARLALLAKQQAFAGTDLADDPEPLRTLSCFAGNLFDDLLAPIDYAALHSRLYFVDLLVGDDPVWEERWQSSFNSAAKTWLRRWLGHWFAVTGMGRELRNYQRREDSVTVPGQEAACAMLLFERLLKKADAYDREQLQLYLQLLAQLGIAAAAQLLQQGSGGLPPHLQRLEAGWGTVCANDIRAEIAIELYDDNPEGFAGALQQLLAIIEGGFPRNYQLVYTSRARSLLPVAGLAESGTHHFFADALRFAELHPLLDRYARTAMFEYAWYTDGEPGGQELMPSSYAVFGLALASPAAARLLARYCALVDGGHQPATTPFLLALVRRYGLAEATLPMLVDVALTACYISDLPEQLAQYLQPGDRERLEAELARRELEDYELEQVRYAFFGRAGVAA
ncbi:DUF6138 family protein [Chitinilyticum aquatile]|uniref:DUF6138 family protein n=1 Tax=Chitinilyticum aquatile TaxID=362520 RepID=UPI00041E0ED2|nr:DUF6138 family protein [Chitinilyticum aquatile]